jgi:hypothetical protein
MTRELRAAAERERAARERERQEQMETMSHFIRDEMVSAAQRCELRLSRLKELHAREVAHGVERLEARLDLVVDKLRELGRETDRLRNNCCDARELVLEFLTAHRDVVDDVF